MLTKPESTRIIKEIQKKYGNVIDLEKSPFILIEILRNYGKLFDDNGGGGVSPGTSTVAVGVSPGTGGGGGVSPGTGGGGGVSPGTSTVAVGITPPSSSERVEIEEILKVVLNLQKEIKVIGKQLARLSSK